MRDRFATTRFAALAAGLVLGLAPLGAKAQLQPGMRTMIQQGGVEGTPLGLLLPIPYGPDPYYGYVYDHPRYGRVIFRDPYAPRRHAGFGDHAVHDWDRELATRVRVTMPRRVRY